jgi:NhaP-type Na+/H+ or K+/H+ antiporter
MSQTVNVLLFLIGGLLLVLSLSGGWIKNRGFLSEPGLALLFGFLIAPLLESWLPFDPSHETLTTILEHLARVTLAIALLDIATDLPKGYFWENRYAILLMVLVVMPLMWVISSLLFWAAVGLPVVACLALGAIVTPTDPVVAHSVVSGKVARKAIPARIRRLILAESACNDVLAYPLVMLAIPLLNHQEWVPVKWFFGVLGWEICGAAAIGLAAGYAASRSLLWAQKSDHTETTSLLTVSVTLALALLGGVKLLHADGLVAVLTAGLVLNRYLGEDISETKEHVHNAIRRLFELPVFVLLGWCLPWREWLESGWTLALLAVALLLLRRPPVLLALRPAIAPVRTSAEAAYMGWFGPLGVAALLYAILVEKQGGLEEAWVYGTFMIAVSALVHGSTATPLTTLFRGFSDDQQNSAERDRRSEKEARTPV